VDRSLWLLLVLKGRAWFRRGRRSVGTLKGLLLAVVGGLIFLPFVLLPLFMPRVQTAAQLDLFRRHGPALLLAYCLLNVLASPGDRAVRYSPAEVGFLFPGPYRPRDLLLCKIAGGLIPALATALLLALPASTHSAYFPSAVAGLVLGVALVFLVSLAVSSAAGLAGSLAFERGRRGLAVMVTLAAVVALAPLGARAWSVPPGELLARVEASPAVVALGLPFVPLVRAFTAGRPWPDLAGWSLAALAVDLAWLGLVLALNWGSLEASDAASARAYDRASAAKQAGPWSSAASRAAFRLPDPPWWGGVGPTAWRQAAAAARAPSRLLGLLGFYVAPVVLTAWLRFDGDGQAGEVWLPLGLLAGVTLVAPSLIGYDFRADLARMAVLKTLPVSGNRLVAGQLLVPAALSTAGAWAALACMAWLTPAPAGLLVAVAALAFPCHWLLMAVENLFFLAFPFMTEGVNSFDVRAVGRQLLLTAAKLATVAAAGALAAGLGAIGYYVSGQSPVAAAATTWVGVSAAALGLVPLVALAFTHFDVAADPPD